VRLAAVKVFCCIFSAKIRKRGEFVMDSAPRKRGRPSAGERVPLGLRVTPEMKEQLDAAVERSGRSQSQEVEYRLQRSFDQEGFLPDTMALGFGTQLAGLVILMAYHMERAGRLATWEATHDVASWKGDAWLQNPVGYDTAVKAAIAVLEAARPPGPADIWGDEVVIDHAANVAAYLSGGPGVPYAADVRRLLGPAMVKRIKSHKPAEKGSEHS
jgi:hypothetical protein